MSRRDPSDALPFPLDGAGAGPSRAAAPDPLAAAFHAHGARMRRVAFRITRDAAAAEDAVASALEKALRHRQAFRGDAKPSTWLHRIVVNEALAWRRSESRRARHTQAAAAAVTAAPAPQPLEALLLRERCDATLGALAQLRPPDRELLARTALDARYAELAPELGLETATLKMRVFRARRALRARLDERPAQQQPESEHGPRVSR